jgi:hypothetical protein
VTISLRVLSLNSLIGARKSGQTRLIFRAGDAVDARGSFVAAVLFPFAMARKRRCAGT